MEGQRKSLILIESASCSFAVDELVTFHVDPYEAARDAHAIVICTEWDEFRVSVVFKRKSGICIICVFKRVVARRAVYHTLNVITISLYVCPSVCVKRV